MKWIVFEIVYSNELQDEDCRVVFMKLQTDSKFVTMDNLFILLQLTFCFDITAFPRAVSSNDHKNY